MSITARVEVIEVNRERNRIRLQTVCTNQRGRGRADRRGGGDAVARPAIDYARSTAPMGALALWTLQPLAWMAQGATIVGMLGLSALSVASARPRSR